MNLDQLTLVVEQPERLTGVESWHRHIPFAFTLMSMLKPAVFVELGTHRGDSYCAFCQAVDHQGLSTRCHAVDTWAGDSQAGYYGDDILHELCIWHDSRYSRFSTLMRMTFDEALQHFADGSLDLLHIDGLHTLEAVTHDYETWLPKLSERGVVLFHDTNVRHSDFAVWKLWDRVRAEYPSFEFPFGNGLGVLAVGAQVPQAVVDFLQYANANPELVVRHFHQLGDAAEAFKMRRQLLETIGSNQSLQRQLEASHGVVEQAHAETLAAEQRHAGAEAEKAQLLQHVRECEERLAQVVAEFNQSRSALQLALEAAHQQASGHSERRLQLRGALHDVAASRWWRWRNAMLRLLGLGSRQVDLSRLLDEPADFR